MKLMSFEIGGRASYGLCTDAGVIDLGRRLGATAPTLRELLALPDWQALARSHADAKADHALAALTPLPCSDSGWRKKMDGCSVGSRWVSTRCSS